MTTLLSAEPPRQRRRWVRFSAAGIALALAVALGAANADAMSHASCMTAPLYGTLGALFLAGCGLASLLLLLMGIVQPWARWWGLGFALAIPAFFLGRLLAGG